MADLVAEFTRYEHLIGPMLAKTESSLASESESVASLQVERGTVYARAVSDRTSSSDGGRFVERLIEVSTSPRLQNISVVDRGGHHRPVYRPLMVYAWLQTFSLWYETLPRAEFGRWEEALRSWCDLLESELGQIEHPPGNAAMPAGRGSSATESAWIALSLHVAGKIFIRDAWTDLASDAFGKLIRRQQSDGNFLLATASDNPETHAYHELVLLHAAASYAVQAEDRTVAAAVKHATEFHLSETQPDHATTQPWGLFAFIWNPQTRPLADQLLHAASVQSADARSGVALMLLADCLYCLRLFTEPKAP